MYTPKKKSYPDLRSMHAEMLSAKPKQKVLSFDGIKIVTKKAEYTMYDGEVYIKDLTSKSTSV